MALESLEPDLLPASVQGNLSFELFSKLHEMCITCMPLGQLRRRWEGGGAVLVLGTLPAAVPGIMPLAQQLSRAHSKESPVPMLSSQRGHASARQLLL